MIYISIYRSCCVRRYIDILCLFSRHIRQLRNNFLFGPKEIAEVFHTK